MSEHTVKKFDAELESIRSRVLAMGGLVEQQIITAMGGLASGDLAVLQGVVKNDEKVNRHEVELDEACAHIIAKRQPTAVDLRVVMMVIKTITDLERIGDEAKKIAKRGSKIHRGELSSMPLIDLAPMATLAVAMLKTALDAFARVDTSASAEVVRQDMQVDASFKAAMRQLITHMMEDPRTISSSLELIFIAKAIERIGDHAKNISEYVVYMAMGRDVRHIGLEEMEKEIAQQ
jgi:phosphate transport system protein